MPVRLFAYILFVLLVSGLDAQVDSLNRIKYTSDFHFKDGVYANFNEWKNNKPRIKDFDVVKNNVLGAQDDIELHYSCADTAGSSKNCIVKNCFGFVRDGNLYISQGFTGYYFRVFIIGGLTHFLAYTGYNDQVAFLSAEPNGFMGAANDFREYVLDFASGQSFQFTYKNMALFLKDRDDELYQELMKSKKKKQMIHHFLLKYNEKHPIYFPEN